jgi:predicted transcriptional regulator
MDAAVLDLTAKLVASYVSNNRLPGDQLSALIQMVYQTLSTAQTAAVATVAKVEPAVAVKKSVLPDRIVCLVCGQGFAMLKRHLGTEHELTPDAYRARYELPRNYPLVSPNYAKTRSKLAKQIGLGRKGQEAARKKRVERHGPTSLGWRSHVDRHD